LERHHLAEEVDRPTWSCAARPDGITVGIEMFQGIDGGGDAGLVQRLLDGLLSIEHGAFVGDSDLDGEGALGAVDDPGGHGCGLPRWRGRSGRTMTGTPPPGYINQM
jgi:hypothetical protein